MNQPVMSRHNLATKEGRADAFQKLSDFCKSKLTIDISIVKNTRTSLQNRALHLYFKFVSGLFLEHGISFKYVDELSGEIIEIPYTPELVKERIWRPVQVAMFNIESTKKLKTFHIDEILSVLSNHFAGKSIEVKFPNKHDLLIKQLEFYEKHRQVP